MKKYAVAIISLIDNDNKVFIESAIDELSAMKKAVISFIPEESERDFMPLLNKAKSSDELKGYMFDCEIGISDALLIS